MWIRSQDKELLVNVSGISIVNFVRNSQYYVASINNTDDNDYVSLGAYSTLERAIEVLDDIERVIKQPKEFDSNEKIYHMPEE